MGKTPRPNQPKPPGGRPVMARALCSCGNPPQKNDRDWCAKHDPPEKRAGFLGLGSAPKKRKAKR